MANEFESRKSMFCHVVKTIKPGHNTYMHFAVFMSRVIANLHSIAQLLEYGDEKKMLMANDARESEKK